MTVVCVLFYSKQFMILSHLNARSLLNMAQACKEMKGLCREGLLWRRLYLKDFGSKFGKLDPYIIVLQRFNLWNIHASDCQFNLAEPY